MKQHLGPDWHIFHIITSAAFMVAYAYSQFV